MKAIKYLLVGVLTLGFGMQSMAQEDNKATIDAITKVIKANPAAAKDQVKQVYKKNKKNPEVLTAIGRAYLDVKDTTNAQQYGELAIKANKNFGPAYVLLGDIEVQKDNGGAASTWFEQATMMDPKNVEGYRRYAQVNSKVSPAAAVAKLEELRRIRPDYPVDIISAEIYDRSGRIAKALEYYEKVDKNKMEDYQLASFATDYFLNQDFEKSLAIAQFGNQKFPRNPGLNRLSFFDLTNLKRYPEALQYADKLFNASDSAKISETDYLYYGYAYQGNKEYQKAIDMFKKSIEMNKDNEEDKQDALKNIANCYSSLGDITQASATYEQYLGMLKKVTAYDMATLASMYMDQADKEEGDKKTEYLKKADEIYGKIADQFPSVADFATLQRAHIGYTLDPESKEGTAKPHYEKLVEVIKGHTEKGQHDDERLIEAYHYLGYYYLLHDDKATADTYWNKVLEIDPNNETAKQALGQ